MDLFGLSIQEFERIKILADGKVEVKPEHLEEHRKRAVASLNGVKREEAVETVRNFFGFVMSSMNMVGFMVLSGDELMLDFEKKRVKINAQKICVMIETLNK